MDLIIWRGLERLFAVIVAALCIYLGYLLFTKLPEKSDSSGKVILPGGISIYLSRVGPGVFFALFGSIIIIYSIITQLEINPKSQKNAENKNDSLKVESSIKYMSSMEGIMNSVQLEEYRSKTVGQIRKLDQFDKSLQNYLDGIDGIEKQLIQDIVLMMPDIKKNMIVNIWSEKWGEFDEFHRWVEGRNFTNIPKSIEKPCNIFLDK